MQEAKHQIRAILFDLGETLLNFGRVNTTRLFRQGAELSYDFLKSLGQPVGNFKYYCWRNLIAIHVRYWLSRITGNDFNALALLKKIGTKKGINLSRQQWQNLIWLWYEPLSKTAKVEPNIAQTLSTLKKSGIKLGILSNTFINGCALERHLQQFGILDFFPVRLYSYQFNFRKPDARIFKAAAQKIGETLQNILLVGDRIDNDIRPAVKIGMQAAIKSAYTNNENERKPPKGVWKINLLSELPTLIEKINATYST